MTPIACRRRTTNHRRLLSCGRPFGNGAPLRFSCEPSARKAFRKSAVASFHEARPHATRNVRHPNMAAHCKTNGAASSFYRQVSVVCLLAFKPSLTSTLKRKSRVPTKRPRDSQPQALPVHPWSEHHGHLRDCSGGAQILGSRLARAAVCNDIEADVLSRGLNETK